MRHIAVILAGGTGSRVGGDVPKQLLPMADGRTILEHAVDAFEQSPCIDEIAIVMHPEWMEEAQEIAVRNEWNKVAKIIPGGEERWESSWHAIVAYMDQEDAALWFHDAARPFVSQRILTDIAEALTRYDAVSVAIPVTDTLYQIEDGYIKSIPNRAQYMRAQTPQAFRIELVSKAYMKALAADYNMATDDAGIVRKFAPTHPIYIVQGDEQNRKITYKEDISV